ncbi:MAG: hypothetical protein AAFP87_17120 [Pseudomonadota bacterium]
MSAFAPAGAGLSRRALRDGVKKGEVAADPAPAPGAGWRKCADEGHAHGFRTHEVNVTPHEDGHA